MSVIKQIGKVRPTYKGPWDETKTYETLDWVLYRGLAYQAVKNVPINREPDVATDYWVATGMKGDKGDRGATGAQGDTGPRGATGPKGDKGEQGESGVTAPANGFFTLAVDANGDLWVYSTTGDTTPTFEYDATSGNLYVVMEVD